MKTKLYALVLLVVGGYCAGAQCKVWENVSTSMARCTVEKTEVGVSTSPAIQQYARHHCTYLPAYNSTNLPFTVDEVTANLIFNY